jgi:hypothetical protein
VFVEGSVGIGAVGQAHHGIAPTGKDHFPVAHFYGSPVTQVQAEWRKGASVKQRAHIIECEHGYAFMLKDPFVRPRSPPSQPVIPLDYVTTRLFFQPKSLRDWRL